MRSRTSSRDPATTVENVAWRVDRGRETEAAAQAEDRIQDRAHGVRQWPAVVDRDRRPDRLAAADEAGPVRLVLDRPCRAVLDRQDVARPQRRIGRRSLPARREQGSDLGDELRLHEEVLEGGMGDVGGLGRERDLRV